MRIALRSPMSPLRYPALAFIACLSAVPAFAGETSGRAPQYVIISFDGAGPIDQWERSRALAERTGARFTYFLSCVYVVAREDRAIYQPPRHGAGRSNVGFAESHEDAALRLNQIWTARAEGHEIASHGCGHFDGGDWSAADWQTEFGQFSALLADAWQRNGVGSREPDDWKGFVENEVVGFRAPYLSTGPGLFDALAQTGFAYDASTVSSGPAMATEGPVRRFALPMIPEGPKGRAVIAMDYNLFVRHSNAVETEDADGAFEERTLSALRAALDAELEGDRVPLQIGLHFTLMNGGTYWRALERFTEDACARPEVRCVSYRGYLDATGPATPADG
jgi:peptidoglycan/xylan/chitin deacetylase (PgdA/CDA1 family)